MVGKLGVLQHQRIDRDEAAKAVGRGEFRGDESGASSPTAQRAQMRGRMRPRAKHDVVA